MSRREEARRKALNDLQQSAVLMLDGHFDYGNGYHGRLYLNPHELFRFPSTIWRFAQDLLDLLPSAIIATTTLVAGPVTGGALLAHTMAGLFDGRRSLSQPPCGFAPFSVDAGGAMTLRPFYAALLKDQHVLLADDVRNTGKTLERCASLVAEAGGHVIATVQIYDRLEAIATLPVPNVPLVEYRAPENYPVERCPLCAAGVPVTTF